MELSSLVGSLIEAAFALMTAFMFALGTILMRKGLSNSNVSSALLVITLIGNIVLWPIVLIQNPKSVFSVYGLLVFAVAGLFHPGLARILYFQGMLKLGVPVNSSIFAMNSMFSVLFAILLLNEQPTAILWLGIAFALVGAAIVQGSVSNEGVVKFKRGALAIPVTGCVVAGLGYALKKIGLNVYGEPLVGVAVAFLISLILYVLLFSVSSKTRNVTRVDAHTFRLFWKAGLCYSIGYLFLFYAMQLGSVSGVTALILAEPLFVLILARFYLRKTDPFSKKLVFGAVGIVLGVVLVTAFGV